MFVFNTVQYCIITLYNYDYSYMVYLQHLVYRYYNINLISINCVLHIYVLCAQGASYLVPVINHPVIVFTTVLNELVSVCLKWKLWIHPLNLLLLHPQSECVWDRRYVLNGISLYQYFVLLNKAL